MKTSLIKYAVIIMAVLALMVYVQYLRGQNKRLTTQVATLMVINDNNATELGRLKAVAALNLKISAQWERDRQVLTDLKRALNTKIQKELQADEDFSDWAGQPLPAATGSMFW